MNKVTPFFESLGKKGSHIPYKSPHFVAGLIFLAISLLTIRSFLFGDSLLIYRDLIWPTNIDGAILNAISTFDLDSMRRIIYIGPLFVLTKFLGLTSLDAEKLYFISTGFMTGFFAYFATYRFLSSKAKNLVDVRIISLMSILAGFFYLYNPFATQKIAVTDGFAFSYSLIPIVFYYFDRALNESSLKNVALASILISLAIAGTAQFLVLLPLFLLIPWFCITLVQRIKKHGSVLLPMKNIIIIASMSLLISSYWIAPSFSISLSSSTPPAPSYILTDFMMKSFSSKTTIQNALQMMGVWWPYVDVNPMTNDPIWAPMLFIIPFLLVLSILFALRKNELRFLVFSFLSVLTLVIFFYKGSQPPIPEFYLMLYRIPIVGWMFRVPDTNGIFLPFFFMMIISLGILNIFNYLKCKSRVLNYLKFIPPTALVFSTVFISLPMFTGDFGGIYKNNKPFIPPSPSIPNQNPDLQITKNNFIVVGGSEVFRSLNSTSPIPANGSSLMYADKDLGSLARSDLSTTTILTDNEGKEDLLMHLAASDSIILKPFDATLKHDPEGRVWSRASTSDPLHGPFHSYLNDFKLQNSDFDYGKGVVFTWNKDQLDIPFGIKNENEYKVFVRYMENPKGGSMTVQLDDGAFEIDTKSAQSNFVWKDLGNLKLSDGKHNVTLENESGFNVVNIIALIPASVYVKSTDELNRLAEQSRMLYLLEETNFHDKGNSTGSDTLFSDVNGTFMTTFVGTIKTPANASSASFEFLAKPGIVNSSYYNITGMTLEPVDNRVLLKSDFENAGDLTLFKGDQTYLKRSIEKDHPISGANSMRVDIVKSSRDSWNVIKTNPIPVNENIRLSYKMNIDAANTNAFHVKVKYYTQVNKDAFSDDYVFVQSKSTFNGTFSNSFTTPKGTNFITFELWVKTNPQQTSSFLIDNIEIQKQTVVSPISQKTIFNGFQNLNQESQSLTRNDNQLNVFLGNALDSSADAIKTTPIPIAGNVVYNYVITVQGHNINLLHSTITYLSKTAEIIDKGSRFDNVIRVNPGEGIFTSINLAKDSIYTIAAHAKSCDSCLSSTLSVDAGEVSHQFRLGDAKEGFQWLYFNAPLKDGMTKLTITTDSGIDLDKMIVYSDNVQYEDLKGYLSSTKEYADIEDYKKIDSTHYEIKVDATAPFVLKLDKSYRPAWSATTIGKHYDPIQLYPNSNGFQMPGEGEMNIKIEYRPQIWFLLGLSISIATILVMIAYLTLGSLRKRKQNKLKL